MRLGAHESIAGGLWRAVERGAALRARSVASTAAELDRCARLGIPWLVMHPGSPMGDPPAVGIARIAQGLAEAYAAAGAGAAEHVTVLLENTAGQGRALGTRF